MVILLVLILLAPAIISVFLYERFKNEKFSGADRVMYFGVFAFIINMFAYVALWIRGHEHIAWTLGRASVLSSVSFCMKYMVLSLLFAIIVPYALSLVKVGKRK